MDEKKHTHIIIFDGQCNLCNTSVNFIMKRDKQALFSFAPLQSDIARSLLHKYKIEDFDEDTVVLIKHETVYIRAEAVYEICKDIDGFFSFLRIFRYLGRSCNDALYRCFAKNRHRFFAKRLCLLPSEELRSRFLTDKS